MHTQIARRLALTLLLACCASPALAADGMTLEPGMDRMGSDYENVAMAGDDPQQCRAACLADAKCKAYTFVNAGVKGPEALCFLKSAPAKATASDCCTSGVRTFTLAVAPGGGTTPIGPIKINTGPMAIDPNGEVNKQLAAQAKLIAAQQAALAQQQETVSELTSLVGAARDQVQDMQAALKALQATVAANQQGHAKHKHALSHVRTINGHKQACMAAEMASMPKTVIAKCVEAQDASRALHLSGGMSTDAPETDAPYQ
jgi:hypothetical protein